MRLRCTTIIVKFLDKLGKPAQELRADKADAAKILQVSRDSDFLTVDYITEQEFSIKQVNFKIDEIKEYDCRSILALRMLDVYAEKLVYREGK